MDPTPDKEQPDQKPPSRGTSGESAEERKFWADEEDAHDAPDDTDPSGETEVSSEAEPSVGTEPSDEEEPSAAAEPSDEDEVDDGPAASDASDEQDFIEDDLGNPAETTGSAPGEESGEPEPAGSEGTSGDEHGRRVSRKDALWLSLLALVVLGAVIWSVSEFLSNVETVGRPDEIDFPIEGKEVVIADVTTYWRKPDLETERVQLGTHLIPCATIVLKAGSGDARLRCFFENEAGEYVGDPITLAVADGAFASSGKAEVDIHGTGGLKGEGEYNAYASTDVEFWHLRVFEGPSSADESEEFQEIATVPISPKRR